jgi:hypothetical protein
VPAPLKRHRLPDYLGTGSETTAYPINLTEINADRTSRAGSSRLSR